MVESDEDTALRKRGDRERETIEGCCRGREAIRTRSSEVRSVREGTGRSAYGERCSCLISEQTSQVLLPSNPLFISSFEPQTVLTFSTIATIDFSSFPNQHTTTFGTISLSQLQFLSSRTSTATSQTPFSGLSSPKSMERTKAVAFAVVDESVTDLPLPLRSLESLPRIDRKNRERSRSAS